jgi:hypothetical protein
MHLKSGYYSLVHRLEQGGGVREGGKKTLNFELWLNIFQVWWMPWNIVKQQKSLSKQIVLIAKL